MLNDMLNHIAPFRRKMLVLVCAFAALLSSARGDEGKPKPRTEELNEESRKLVVAKMKEILDQTKLVRQRPTPVIAELVPEPVLNWDDVPRGHHYGTLWVWGATGRPAAIVETYTINFAKDIGRWPGNAVHSLAAEPLRADGMLGWDWAPKEPGFTPKRLADAPAPAGTKNARRLQMRALAKRFTANQSWMGDQSELRLLPTSIRLYESEEDKVLDGGLFAFVHGGTNPEIILVLEAIRGTNADYWQFGCVRLGHARMQAKFDDREVWSVETYDGINPNSPYYWLTKR